MIDSVIKIQNFDNASTKETKHGNYPDTVKKQVWNKVNAEDINKYENKRVKEAIEHVVHAANYFNRKIRLEVDNDIMIVKVIDEKTGQVIRQIPSEEIVELSKNAKDLKGLLINKEG